MSEALSDRSTADLKEEVRENLTELLGDLIEGARRTHRALSILELLNPKYSGSLNYELDPIAAELRSAGERHRKVEAAWTVLVDRAKKAKESDR